MRGREMGRVQVQETVLELEQDWARPGQKVQEQEYCQRQVQVLRRVLDQAPGAQVVALVLSDLMVREQEQELYVRVEGQLLELELGMDLGMVQEQEQDLGLVQGKELVQGLELVQGMVQGTDCPDHVPDLALSDLMARELAQEQEFHDWGDLLPEKER